MNINATQEELEGIAEVLKLAAILDDRAPRADKARIVAWAEQIHPHKIGTDDLLAGLQSYYDSPSERAMQIGDLIHHAKTARQIRTSRESAAEREAREDRRDAALEQRNYARMQQITRGFGKAIDA
ncbi:hypothetical protein [Mycolicibacterium llatzerense]|uniref:hypothetical protein n=1 Tax=Mycolicibacterium llatzerense TaxID=280871 RepID=UPI0021B6CF96|nr:hypothetical protein [Mycolicibacterium llatzerense]MCT7373215.1 hypothetical protein [Mycolicibacterium llatzerense]